MPSATSLASAWILPEWAFFQLSKKKPTGKIQVEAQIVARLLMFEVRIPTFNKSPHLPLLLPPPSPLFLQLQDVAVSDKCFLYFFYFLLLLFTNIFPCFSLCLGLWQAVVAVVRAQPHFRCHVATMCNYAVAVPSHHHVVQPRPTLRHRDHQPWYTHAMLPP